MGKTLGIICKEFDFGKLLKERFSNRTTFEQVFVANPGDASFSYDCTHYLVHLGEKDLDLTPLFQRNPNAKLIVFSTKTANREDYHGQAVVYDSAMSAWRACEREAPKAGIDYKSEVYGE